MIAMIGTSDRLCWLAETCKILLLLLCHLPVSGRGMQRFLQFRLGCHSLPVAAGRLAGAAHVDRAHRVCLACNSGAVGDEMHLVFKFTALASLRSR